jgi:uncharacterized membrane protein
MTFPSKSRLLHLVSRVGFVMKGIDGLLECAGAFILLTVSPRAISAIVRLLTEHELSRDPTDFLSTHLVLLAHEWSVRPKIFFALYLMVHGGVKVLLVAGLLRRKLWVYPIALLFMVILILYQLYRYSHTHSPVIGVFTALDTVVTLFIALDYRYVRKQNDQGLTC